MCDDQVRVISISVFPDSVLCMCWEPLSSSPYLETWLDVVCYGCPILAIELFPLFFFSLTKHRSKMLDQSDLWKAWFWLSVGGCHPSWQERHSSMKGSSRGSRRISVAHAACTARKERGMLVLSWLPPSLPPFSVLSGTPVHGMVPSTLETPSETSQRCCPSRHHKYIRPTSPLQFLLFILSLCLPCLCDHSQMESLVALSTLLCDQYHHSSSGVLSFFPTEPATNSFF